MKFRAFFAILVMMATSGMAVSPVQAQNLVTNGDFELPNIGNNIDIVYPTGANIAGWLVASGDVDVAARGWQQISGAQSLDLSGNQPGTIYQDLHTVPGQVYTLRMAIAPNPSVQGSTSPVIKKFQIMWGSLVIDTPTLSQTGYTSSNMGWRYINYTVQAASATTRLQFVSLTPGNGGMAIDDVSVIPSAAQGAIVTGTVTLQGCNDPEQAVTFEFRPKPSGTPFKRKQLLTPSGTNSGDFTLPNIPFETYDIAVKGYCWLRRVIPNVVITADTFGLNVTLLTGDLNNDDLVDIGDFGWLVGNYGTSGDP